MDLELLRHSTAHVMAAAICRLYENVQLDIGPATDAGFYYDFDLPHRLVPEDFVLIEREMAKVVAENLPYLFRSIALNGGPKRLYAQEMGRTEEIFFSPRDKRTEEYISGRFG